MIYTAYKLTKPATDWENRNFIFNFGGVDYECGFSDSSKALLCLAMSFRPIGPTLSNYRNLVSFYQFSNTASSTRTGPNRFGKPISFWIKDIDWEEDRVLKILSNLNFFMTYYDSFSPSVIIHDVVETEEDSPEQFRYRHGIFPAAMGAKPIDQDLLHFWYASFIGDNARRFGYLYRIIEYSSYTYMDSGFERQIKKIISSPHSFGDIHSTAISLAAALQETRLDDVNRFLNVFKDSVDMDLIFEFVEKNIDFFSCQNAFDGGFRLEALVSPKIDRAEFKLNGAANCCSRLRAIRNALSHGRDQKSSSVITPTERNFERLGPWVTLLTLAAGEVMLYHRFD